MFEQTLLPVHATGRRPFGVLAICLQALVVGLMVLAQLFYTQPLPNAQLRLILAGPPPPLPKPIPIMPSRSAVTQTTHLTRFRLMAPVVIPHQVAMMNENAPDAPSIPGAMPGTGEGGGNNDLLTGLTKDAPAAPPAMVEKPPAAPRGPMRVGGSVAAANLIQQIQPAYPPLARSARVEGTVEFSAVIDTRGAVVNLKLVRGHPLLVAAARDAILQWRYRPTTLNGQPVDVVTTITVNFKLSN